MIFFRNSGKVPSIKLENGNHHSRRLIVEQFLNLKDIGNEFNLVNPSIPVDPVYPDEDLGSGSASGSGYASGESGSGHPDTTAKITYVITRPSPSTDQIPLPVSTTDQSTSSTDDVDGMEGSGTLPVSTTDQSTRVSSTDDVDGMEGSGTTYNKYTTTPISVNAATTDDEELGPSGSGDKETTDPIPTTEAMFLPTENDSTKIFLLSLTTGTIPVDNGSGSNMMSYVFLLLVTLVGLMNM